MEEIRVKKEEKKIFINEDLTAMRAAMMKMKEPQEVKKNFTTRDGKFVAWMKN